jgi:hypothetical protein
LETSRNDTDGLLKQIRELRMTVDQIKMGCYQEQDTGIGQDNLIGNGKEEDELGIDNNDEQRCLKDYPNHYYGWKRHRRFLNVAMDKGQGWGKRLSENQSCVGLA